MSPGEALDPENTEKLRLRALEYAQEFKKGIKMQEFELGDTVLMRNETKLHKHEKNYEKFAKIKNRVSPYVFEIEDESGNIYKRHSSQLILVKTGDVVSDDGLNVNDA